MALPKNLPFETAKIQNNMENQEQKKQDKTFSEALLETDTATQVMVMASLGLTLQQIADFTGMTLQEFKTHLDEEGDPIRKAFRKGKAMIEVELANVIRTQAMNGDTTAIGRLAEKLRKQSLSEEL